MSTDTHFNSQGSLRLPPNRHVSLQRSFREYGIISTDCFTEGDHMGTRDTTVLL